MTGDDFRAMALALDGTTEQAHMKHPDFRVQGRVFASLLSNEERAGLNLSPGEQRELLRQHPRVFEPASGAWGRKGWTIAHLPAAPPAVVRGALLLAYENTVARTRRRRT